MRIINGKKFMKKDMERAVKIDKNGWDRYNGQNWQWYTLKYDTETGYTELDASNSGSCYGDYNTYRFESPKSFLAWCNETDRNWEELLGDIDENDVIVTKFIEEITA